MNRIFNRSKTFQLLGVFKGSGKTFKRGSPLFIFLVFFTFMSINIIGSYIQLCAIWKYPSLDWKKSIIEEKANDGIWTWLVGLTYFNPEQIGYISLIFTFAIALGTWLLSTKVKALQMIWIRYLIFSLAIFAFLLKWTVWSSVPAKTMFEPWIAEVMRDFHSQYDQELNLFLEDNIRLYTQLILVLPITISYWFATWYMGLLMRYSEGWNRWFKQFEFQHHRLQWLTEVQRKGHYPDIAIGIYADVMGKVKAILRGKDRSTHTVVVGSIGSGKSAAMALPLIWADMKHLITYINNFLTDDDKTRQQRLSGMTIIDPSNDLATKTHQLAKAHGIPEEAIFYLDPSNPNTKSYNPLRGPTETVAATLVYVLEGLQPDQDDFYKNAQATHLYNHILLLKLSHDNRELIRLEIESNSSIELFTYEKLLGSDACTLDTLMKLYSDPWLTNEMWKSLATILPSDWERTTNKDELARYSIINQVIIFMESTYRPKTDRSGESFLAYPEGHRHEGKIEIIDTQDDFIKGLKNILNQMASNTMFRRVMFGDDGLDLDSLLKTGGVLIINTADGEMGRLSYYFGAIMIQSLVAAVYRRDLSKGQPSGHHIVIDEFPKYAYENYYDFPANSRKYGAMVTICMQTIAQLALKFGNDYLETVIGVHRNRMVYQGVPLKDAEYFSKYFGTVKQFKVSESQNYSPSTQDNPSLSLAEKYDEKDVERFQTTDISESDSFHAVLQLNVDNKQQPARLVRADFVPASEFKDATEKPDPEAAAAWVRVIKEEARKGMETKPASPGRMNESINSTGPLHDGPRESVRKIEENVHRIEKHPLWSLPEVEENDSTIVNLPEDRTDELDQVEADVDIRDDELIDEPNVDQQPLPVRDPAQITQLGTDNNQIDKFQEIVNRRKTRQSPSQPTQPKVERMDGRLRKGKLKNNILLQHKRTLKQISEMEIEKEKLIARKKAEAKQQSENELISTPSSPSNETKEPEEPTDGMLSQVNSEEESTTTLTPSLTTEDLEIKEVMHTPPIEKKAPRIDDMSIAPEPSDLNDVVKRITSKMKNRPNGGKNHDIN